MKILSAILAMLMLFLSVEPMLADSNVGATSTTQTLHKCCAGKQNAQPSKTEKQKQQNSDCCHSGRCDNPFLSCSNCYFICFDRSAFLTAAVLQETGKMRLTSDKLPASYIQEFWHPPNLISQIRQINFEI